MPYKIKKLKDILVDVVNSFYDLKNFLIFSFKEESLRNKNEFIAFLSKQYHMIEKGLSLEKPRIGFGKEKVNTLIEKTNIYIDKYGEDELTESIVKTLNIYSEFSRVDKNNEKYYENIKNFCKHKKTHDAGGYFLIERGTTKKEWENFNDFFTSRKSYRNFIDAPIENKKIIEAIDIAKYTPSVCNRQGWKIHVYKNELAKEVLKYQSGNNGFTDKINNIAIITGDISYFTAYERNQVNIDSGMFSMSFILALHSLGISSCALNACFSCKTEEKLKEIASIPKNEKVVMFIAFGYAQEVTRIAHSHRRDSNSFVKFHNIIN